MIKIKIDQVDNFIYMRVFHDKGLCGKLTVRTDKFYDFFDELGLFINGFLNQGEIPEEELENFKIGLESYFDVSEKDAEKIAEEVIWKNKMGKHLRVILKEMCKRVGAKFEEINFKKQNWFMKFSWTEKEQNEFIDWLTNYLYQNSEARKEVMKFPVKDKKRCKEVAIQFVSFYGWKTKTRRNK